MTLIKQYTEAKDQIEKLVKESSNIKGASQKQISNIEYRYRDQIYELEKKRDNEIRDVQEYQDNQIKDIDTLLEEQRITTNKVKRILTLMDIIRDNPSKLTPEVYFYSDRDAQGNYVSKKVKMTIDPVKTILEDKYSKVMLYIVPNGKPTNKFSLIIRGYSIFGEGLLGKGISFGYVNRINDSNSNIRIVVKDAADKQSLIDYMNRNMKKILGMLPALSELNKKYEEALTLYEQPAWKILYLEDKKDYYENHYFNGTETPEYAAVLSEIKRLKKLTN